MDGCDMICTEQELDIENGGKWNGKKGMKGRKACEILFL